MQYLPPFLLFFLNQLMPYTSRTRCLTLAHYLRHDDVFSHAENMSVCELARSRRDAEVSLLGCKTCCTQH